MTNGNEPAFSKSAFYHPEGGADNPQEGLSKREYFAAMAMSGILSNPAQVDIPNFEWVSSQAIEYADAIIEQLNK